MRVLPFLSCPSCGLAFGGSLHHNKVLVEQAPQEDEDGFGFLVEPNCSMTVSPRKREEFLGRRDAIRISFTCEQCKEVPDLLIMQHKGDTFIGWEDETPLKIQG